MNKRLKSICMYSLCLMLILPLNLFAYSDYIIPGGQTVGIKLQTKGVMVVGFYDVNGKNVASNSSLKVGDVITSINGNSVQKVDQLVKYTKKEETLTITYVRNSKEYSTTLKVIKDNKDNLNKTGLYVKDSINGLGTLTYIDPNTKIYGALGHEIIEKSTGDVLNSNDGLVFKSEVTKIIKSTRGSPGEKNATFNFNDILGTVKENTISGIFGNYVEKLPNKKALKVASKDEIKLGKAEIYTVLDGITPEAFKINITKIELDNNKKTKNFLFEITDKTLLEKTGGIVQGMSGSPIIQNNMIIGAVTHVLVDNTTKGYGIYIVNMLEEGEN
ncbi:MAG: SpoIVB peptidase [Bacilli bacterium]